MKFLQPPNWPRPKGYANGVAARGTLVFLSGVVGWNAQGQFADNDFVAQVRQALLNIVEILKQAEAKPEHIARMTWYVLDKSEYLPLQRRDIRSWYVLDKSEYLSAAAEVGMVYREIIGRHYLAMT